MRRLYAVLLILALAGACTGAEPDRLLKEGEESWHRGEYDRAMDLFHKVVEAYPKHPRADEALLGLGDIHYLFLNRPDDALVYYQDLINLYPGSRKKLDARMKMAAIYRGKKNDCQRAVVEYQEALGDGPPPEVAAEAQYQIALCYYQNGDLQQALTEYEILLNNYPSSSYAGRALYGLAECDAALGRYQQAIKNYRKVIDTIGDRDLAMDARFGIATCHEDSGLLPEALAAFREILEGYPNRQVVADHIRKIEENLGKNKSGAK